MAFPKDPGATSQGSPPPGGPAPRKTPPPLHRLPKPYNNSNPPSPAPPPDKPTLISLARYPVLVKSKQQDIVLKGMLISDLVNPKVLDETPEETAERMCDNLDLTLLSVGCPEEIGVF